MIFSSRTNPILAAFRDRGDVEYPSEWLVALDSLRLFGGYREWDHPGSYFHPLTLATEGQVRHAFKVLNRLSRVRANRSG